MNEVIERIEELMYHYKKAHLMGEYFGLKIALEIIKRVNK